MNISLELQIRKYFEESRGETPKSFTIGTEDTNDPAHPYALQVRIDDSRELIEIPKEATTKMITEALEIAAASQSVLSAEL